MFLQLLRRFYETHCMQIFSKDSHLNTIFYLATLGYYPALITGIIVTSPGFADGVDNNNNSVNWRHITGMGIFLFSWWNQFRSNRILVNLRKDSSGKYIHPYNEYFARNPLLPQLQVKSSQKNITCHLENSLSSSPVLICFLKS